MKFNETNLIATRSTKRMGQTLVAAAILTTLVACGGGGDGGAPSNPSSSNAQGSAKLQVVAFGDELSDVGTYAPNILLGFGGGRYTTVCGLLTTPLRG